MDIFRGKVDHELGKIPTQLCQSLPNNKRCPHANRTRTVCL